MTKKERKEYNTKYMRQYRGLKRSCSTCAKYERCQIAMKLCALVTHSVWHCCNWKKSIVISIKGKK